MLQLALDVCKLNSMDKDCVYDRHRDTIKKLKFITMIEQGERINVHSVSTTQESWFSSIYRTIFKESRAKTFQFMSDVIDRSFELVALYKDSKKLSDKISCYQILDDIIQSITGIKNIQMTYISDRNFYCEMETLLSSIYARLAEIYQNQSFALPPQTKEKLDKIFQIVAPAEEEKCNVEEVSNTPNLSPLLKPLTQSSSVPAL